MEYIAIVFLLMGSAFFSGTEIAYTSLNKLRMKEESGNLRGAEKRRHFQGSKWPPSPQGLRVGSAPEHLVLSGPFTPGCNPAAAVPQAEH